jgi:hypothetical protein
MAPISVSDIPIFGVFFIGIPIYDFCLFSNRRNSDFRFPIFLDFFGIFGRKFYHFFTKKCIFRARIGPKNANFPLSEHKKYIFFPYRDKKGKFFPIGVKNRKNAPMWSKFIFIFLKFPICCFDFRFFSNRRNSDFRFPIFFLCSTGAIPDPDIYYLYYIYINIYYYIN